MNRSTPLKQLVTELQHRYGAKALRPVNTPEMALPRLSTGIEDLDRLLNGGLPRGKISEITSKPTSGTTSLALAILAHLQRGGGQGVYFDMAGVFDADYAIDCGIIAKRLLILQPADGLEAGQMLKDVLVPDHITLCILNMIGAGMRDWLEQQKQALVRWAAPTRSVCLVLTDFGAQSPLTDTAYLRLGMAAQDWLFEDGIFTGYRATLTVLKHQMHATGGKIPYTVNLEA